MTQTYRRQDDADSGAVAASVDGRLYGSPQHDDPCTLDDRERYGEPQHDSSTSVDDRELYGDPQHDEESGVDDDLLPYDDPYWPTFRERYLRAAVWSISTGRPVRDWSELNDR